MLEKLFGNPNVEKLLFYLLINGEGYSLQLSKIFQIPIYSVQKAFERLEAGGILVSQKKGQTRIYQFNPRYPFLKELKDFLRKAYRFLPEEYRLKYYETPAVRRRRPRRKGKPLP